MHGPLRVNIVQNLIWKHIINNEFTLVLEKQHTD